MEPAPGSASARPAQTVTDYTFAAPIASDELREKIGEAVGVQIDESTDVMMSVTTARTSKVPEFSLIIQGVGEMPVDPETAIELYEGEPGLATNDCTKKMTATKKYLDAIAQALEEDEMEPPEEAEEPTETEMQGITASSEPPASAEPAQPVAPTPKPKRPTVPKTKTESAAVAAAARKAEVEIEKMETKLDELELESIFPFLIKANILSLAKLRKYSLAELIDSLRRPSTGLGAKFSFDKIDTKALLESKLLAGGSLAPPAPAPAEPPKSKATTPRGFLDGFDLDDDELEPADEDEEVDAAFAAAPEPAKASSWATALFDECNLARSLFGNATEGELKAQPVTIAKVCAELSKAVGSPLVFSASEAVEDCVCRLEMVLASGLRQGIWEEHELARGSAKIAMHSAHLVCLASERNTGGNKAGPSGSPSRGSPVDNGIGDLAASLQEMQEQNHNLSTSDQKKAQEITASNQRIDAVASDAAELSMLRKLHDSLYAKAGAVQSDADKISAYAAVSKMSAVVAAALKSSHIREPKGALNLRARKETTRLVREVQAAVMGANAAEASIMLPAHAETQSLAEAAFWGTLDGSGDVKFDVSTIAEPKSQKAWLGEAKQGSSKSKLTESTMLITLTTAMPALQFTLAQSQPRDSTIVKTMTLVSGEMMKGIRRVGVQQAVEGILAPLLRAYALGWVDFQRAATATLPELGKVWTKISTAGPVAAFVALSSAAPAAEDSRIDELQKELKTQRDQIEALKRAKKLAPPKPPGSGRRTPGSTNSSLHASDNEEELTPEQLAERKKAKNKAKRDRTKELVKKGRAAMAGAADEE